MSSMLTSMVSPVGWAYWVFAVAIVGSALLGLSTAMNAITIHITCTNVWVGVFAIIALLVASIRTLHKLSWLSYVGLVSILSAIFMVTIAVGIQDRPSDAPSTGPWDKQLVVFGNPTFTDATLAMSNLLLAFAGTPF